MARYGDIVAKALELLATGLLVGLAKSKKGRLELLEESDYLWHTIDRKKLKRVLEKLKLQGLVDSMAHGTGEKFSITARGRRKFLEYKFYTLKAKPPKSWDKKWRIVLFDVPEARRKARNALRRKLRDLGFLEFQKSVFIFPYPCADEINFVINFLEISDYVYCLTAPIVPDDAFRSHFRLS